MGNQMYKTHIDACRHSKITFVNDNNANFNIASNHFSKNKQLKTMHFTHIKRFSDYRCVFFVPEVF